jgi:hypothetical protein
MRAMPSNAPCLARQINLTETTCTNQSVVLPPYWEALGLGTGLGSLAYDRREDRGKGKRQMARRQAREGTRKQWIRN